MKRIKKISRDFEFVMGIIGSVIALLSGSLIVLIENFNVYNTPTLAVVAIIGFILGLISSFYVKKDAEMAGVGFIIASICAVLATSYMSILSAILLILAGISALFRK